MQILAPPLDSLIVTSSTFKRKLHNGHHLGTFPKYLNYINAKGPREEIAPDVTCQQEKKEDSEFSLLRFPSRNAVTWACEWWLLPTLQLKRYQRY